jgi:hypothetical protein
VSDHPIDSTAHNEQEWAGDEAPGRDELPLTRIEPGGETETFTLTQHLLGLRPYVLIEAKPDDDDPEELALAVSAGRVEDDKIGYLPLLMLTALPANINPLTIAAEAMIVEHPDLAEPLAAFAEYVGFPMTGGE